MEKKEARTIWLTEAHYMQVIPWWCAAHKDCWDYFVKRWCDPEWQKTHEACRERRLKMPGPAHHQGNHTLDEYAARWSRVHGGQPCHPLKAWAMAHKGKATSIEVDYNPEDPPEAYSNATVHSRLSQYTEMAREVHGPEWDPSTEDLDGKIIMRVGGGKKHGQYWIGHGLYSHPLSDLSEELVLSPAHTPTAERCTDSAQLREEMEAKLQEQEAMYQARLQEQQARYDARLQEQQAMMQEEVQRQMQTIFQQ
ncbi:hypothetical protein EJB05_27268 [Eragrostis curvula]|uniref:Transposase-associated domain-containing protein n=1 Tax=Eragrostis curvula TaxID=38414 RepID=A0A5J9ULX0_9POAL|nr:hypothetical protein EJB05_27268 [Eragrostis curvula]